MADRNLRIRMLLEAADKVTRPLRDMAQGSSRLAQSLRATRDRLKDIQRAQSDIGGFRELKAGVRLTEQAMQAAQTRVGALAREIQQTENPTRAMTREFERARREAQQLSRQHDAESRELQTLRDRLRAAGVSTGDLARHERELRDRAADTNRELEEQTRRVDQVSDRQRRFGAARDRFARGQGMATGMAAGGAASLATGAALARPIIGGVEQAQQFQSGMTDIAQKANLTRAQAEKMGASLLVAARAANQMPADLQKGVDTLSGFGLDPRQAVEMMKPIGRGATAYKAEIDDLSAAAFAANDNLKVPVAQTARVIDIMAEAGKAGAFEIKDMAGAFPALTAGYQALGQTGTGAVADLAAALQIARKGAGDSATAANNVANIIQKIASPATIKAFARFGIDLPSALKKAYAEGKTPLEAIAELTRKATGGDLGKIGFLFEDAQVHQGLRPIIQNLEEYRAIRAKAAAANGTTDADFAERMKDSAEETRALKVNAEALGISLSATLLPTVNAIARRAGAFANRLSAWSQRHPALTRAIVLTAAGLSALFIALGIGAIALAGIVGPMYLFAAASTYTGIALLPIIGIAAAVVAGIVLLAGAAYLIYRNWGALSGFFSGLWGAIQSRFAAAADAVTGVFRGIWAGVKSLFSMSLGDVLNNIVYFHAYALGALFRFGGTVAGWLTGTLPGLLASGWSAAWSMFTGAISASWSWLTTRLPVMLANGWNVAWNAFKSAMRAAFVTLPTMFADFGVMIITGLWNGLKSAPGRLFNAGVQLANSLAGGFRAGAKIRSPSRVFMALGGHIIGGLNSGLDRDSDGAVNRISRLTRDMAAAAALPVFGAGGLLSPNVAAAGAFAARGSGISIAADGPAGLPDGASARGAAAGSAPASVQYITIKIYGAAGQNPGDIGKAVRDALEDARREQAANNRSNFADRPDWED
ncbi:phage tail tape measure protein [Sphingomonas hylomeconis]|uniref:Phage tail tape measure protein n=1 Tax=Sphingomonas hylomeconis TaxID=1395958 RepID=A0ABV7SS57_9SPHN|nr:phage tail tape measure protein [Sphingomonas hylomeconis]